MVKIVVPTKGRADRVLTNVDGQILVVDKSEELEYRVHADTWEIEVCPDFNNLAAKRNWILDRFGDVFMLDDDVHRVFKFVGDSKDLAPTEARQIIEQAHWQAKQLGVYLFGFNNSGIPAHYNAMKPLMPLGMINGCAMGIIAGGGLRFDPRFVAAEDHYMVLLNAYKHRRCFIDKRYHFNQRNHGTFCSPGGQSANRTLETEKMDTLLLRAQFGEAVTLKRQRFDKGSHQFMRELKIPL